MILTEVGDHPTEGPAEDADQVDQDVSPRTHALLEWNADQCEDEDVAKNMRWIDGMMEEPRREERWPPSDGAHQCRVRGEDEEGTTAELCPFQTICGDPEELNEISEQQADHDTE